MAENNNFDFRESFDYITSALDSIRAQNAMSAGVNDKLLNGINNQLQTLLGEETSDLMKVFMLELKKSLDERHHFVAVKFGEIESSFENMLAKAESQLQPSEIKELFEIIAQNFNTFSTDFSSQKELITELDLKIEELKQDESSKKEILKNISTLKVELEKVNNGFESVILNLSTNFKEVAKTLDSLDKSDELGEIKKEIENVGLSTSAVLSTMQVIDHKNRELEEIITHLVSKEDFDLEREQVAKLIEQNTELSEYVNKLPTQSNVEILSEKFDTSIGVINALKNMLIETGKQNQQLLTAQLDSLETKILNISTEEEFIGFRKELAEFAQTVGESTNLMRTDIADTNANLKELIEQLNPSEIKTTFADFNINTKVMEASIKESIAGLSEHVSKESEKGKKHTQTTVAKSVEDIAEKISEAKNEIAEGSKLNLASILEHVQGVVNNIFAVKNALHIENLENKEAVDAKFLEMKEEIATSNNFLAQTANTNLGTITSGIDKVSQELEAAKSDLSSKLSNNATDFGACFGEISKKIETIKEELNQTSQENFANISSVADDFSQEAASIKTSLEKTTSIGFANLKTNIEELAQEFNYFTQNFDVKNQENLSSILSRFENVAKDFDSYKEFLSQSAQLNFETISHHVQEISHNIDRANTNLSEDLKVNIAQMQSAINVLPETIREAQNDFQAENKADLEQMQNLISVLPETIKETQNIFGNENRVLLEENSRSIVEMGDKIHSLIRSLMAKENPLKGELLGAFDELKSNFEVAKGELSNATQTLEENVVEEIRSNIQNVEDLISQFNERYDGALIDLQNRLGDKLELIDQTAQNNNFKLSDSIKETSEIKEEIQSLAQNLDALKDDTALLDLTDEISAKFEGLVLNLKQVEEASVAENKEVIQEALGSLDEKFELISEDLKKYQNLSAVETAAFVSDLKEKVDTIKAQVGLSATDIINALTEKEETVLELLVPLKEAVEKITEADFAETITEIKNKIDSSLSSISATIYENIEHENEELARKFAQDFEVLNDKFEQIVSKTSLHTIEFSNIKDVLDEIITEVKERFILLNEKLNNNEFLTGQFEHVKEVLSDNSNAVFEKMDTFEEKLLSAQTQTSEEISSKMNSMQENLDEFGNKMFEAQNEVKEEISGKINQIHEELENVIVNELQENIGVIKEVLAAVSENKDEEVPQKMAEIETSLLAASEKIDKILENTKKDPTKAMQSWVSEVKTSFYEKVDDSMDDLRSFMEVAETKADLSGKIDGLKDELFDKFAKVSTDFEENIAAISVKEDLNDLKMDLESSIAILLEDLSGKIASLVEDNTSSEMLEKTEEIARRIEDLKTSVSDDITNKLAEFELNLEKQSGSFAELLETTKGSLAELKENFVDLSLNSTMEISSLLLSVQEKIDNIESKFAEFNLNEEFAGIESKLGNLNFDDKFENIENKLSELNFDDKFDGIENKLSAINYDEKFDEIKTTIENIDLSSVVEKIETNFTKFDVSEEYQNELKQEFETINQKLDLFAMGSDTDIKEDVAEIKQIVESQNELIKQFGQAGGNENVVSATSGELKNILEKFEDKLNLLSLEGATGEDNSGVIKQELTSFKEELFENLIEFFNQISFVAEAEEIKDFVDEKTEEIKRYLKTIQTVQAGVPVEPMDDSGYTYTLQDVESDIAKVRMAINDIAKSSEAEKSKPEPQTAPSEEFEQLNENIMSISSRTNKLLLNSDESNAALKNNLDDLRNIVDKLEEKIKHIDTRESMARVERKLKSMDKMLVSSVQSDRVFNQALMYLAEWIDKADEKMSSIEDKISDIEDIKMSMLRSYDLEMFLDKFVRRIDRQQDRMKVLEEKIEKLGKTRTKAAPTPEVDVKAVVQEVLSKIELSEKPDEKLVKKMDGIDRRLTTLGKNIEKITSYVEE